MILLKKHLHCGSMSGVGYLQSLYLLGEYYSQAWSLIQSTHFDEFIFKEKNVPTHSIPMNNMQNVPPLLNIT